MAWLWNTWEEYAERVRPVVVTRSQFHLSKANTRAECVENLQQAFADFQKGVFELEGLGFDKDDPTLFRDLARSEKGSIFMYDAVLAGEELLLYHRRLALDDASYGFLHAHEIYECWEQYSGSLRAGRELHRFVRDCKGLWQGYTSFRRMDDVHVVNEVGDLPDELRSDFVVTRNLASVGFDDEALLIACRGFEGVLRTILRERKVVLQTGSRKSLASEADLHDVIEVLARLRWKVTGSSVITPSVKTLLQFIRTTRNSQAHPISSRALAPREMAKTIALNANEIWKNTRTKAKMETVLLEKNWQ